MAGVERVDDVRGLKVLRLHAMFVTHQVHQHDQELVVLKRPCVAWCAVRRRIKHGSELLEGHVGHLILSLLKLVHLAVFAAQKQVCVRWQLIPVAPVLVALATLTAAVAAAVPAVLAVLVRIMLALVAVVLAFVIFLTLSHRRTAAHIARRGARSVLKRAHPAGPVGRRRWGRHWCWFISTSGLRTTAHGTLFNGRRILEGTNCAVPVRGRDKVN
mmetsp:Transcript_34463/g.79813  ORF Transcript_34463/g.79813 Transcript_34463/m.79813 type:complete len:215 (-) Transcript_34463:1153-1797(-)